MRAVTRVALAACALAALAPAQDDPWTSFATALAGDGTRLALRDLDGDARLDAVEVLPGGLRVRLQGEAGAFAGGDDVPTAAWPSDHMTWCFDDLDGDGAVEWLTLTAEGRVEARSASSGAFGEPRVVLESRCYLPHGINRMGFARDVDVDGRADLVLPGSGVYRIHLQQDDGTFADAIEIAFDVQVRYDVGDPRSLDSRFGQSVRVPWFRVEDVDGDGRDDLVSRTETRVDFHLARPDLAATPTWSLDLVELAQEIPERDGIDFDDLLSNLDLGVKYSIEELDGEAPRDLILQLGGTVKVYLGGSVRGVAESPDQVLKISGNLLHVLVRDTDGDDRPDLQLLRGDKVSLGRVLRWLVLPGALDFEFFTYRNEGGAFARKPTRRNTVSLKIPRLLTLMDRVEEIEDEIERQQAVPARRLDRDGSGGADDVVDYEQGALRFFDGCAPPEDEDKLRGFRDGDMEQAMRDLVLDDLDRMDDGDTKVIDVGDLDTWTYSPGAAMRKARQGREAALVVPTAFAEDAAVELAVVDLDGDGRGDVVAWAEREDGGYDVQLVVLRD